MKDTAKFYADKALNEQASLSRMTIFSLGVVATLLTSATIWEFQKNNTYSILIIWLIFIVSYVVPTSFFYLKYKEYSSKYIQLTISRIIEDKIKNDNNFNEKWYQYKNNPNLDISDKISAKEFYVDLMKEIYDNTFFQEKHIASTLISRYKCNHLEEMINEEWELAKHNLAKQP